MTIESIDWHIRNQANLVSRLRREMVELLRIQESVSRLSVLAPFRLKQIEAAKAKGQKGFDAEKFMANVNPLNNEVK